MAELQFLPCPVCKRHVRAVVSQCPFCASRFTRSLAVHMAAAGAVALIAGCTPPPQDTIVPMGAPAVSVSSEPPALPTGDAPRPSAPSASASATPENPDGPPMAAEAPPGPPPRQTAEAYGPPPPRQAAAVYGPPPPRPQVPAYGPPPSATQPRTTENVRRVFLAARQRFKDCWLKTSPSQPGRASVHLTITPNGRVSTAQLKDSDLPESVNRCILSETRKLQFDPGPDPTSVVFPLRFQP